MSTYSIPHQPRFLFFVASLAALMLVTSRASAEKADAGKPVAGTIQVTDSPRRVDLPARAKISFERALTAALAAAPGHVIKGELEVEDGCLMYSFEVVTPQHTVVEVEIDAGNGAVLDIDRD
ncbi:PepSY domain-containing protein [Horticoccus luteus]|uniref:PepSY domain-containing protein n=1 Tax=Horticoccus luteus TaxID=2862869 RepID=A0A8F9TV26_9BACT|nr:PepSY domain-containing protein [Horticoccus luteus]QYM79651.1 PepSY domain-containing protein [Horticoccus luteus]